MASAAAGSKMREEATCSICLNLMSEPVSINCGHSFCQACLLPYLGSQFWPVALSCPLCRAPFQREGLRPNRQLGRLIDAIREMDRVLFCGQHGESLHLFCQDDGQLICWRCEREPGHRGHTTALVEDVSQGYKEELQEAAANLRFLEEKCRNQKASTQKQMDEWIEKIEGRRQKIQDDFKSLHSFLHEEEKAYLCRLEEEKEQTLFRLQASLCTLEQKTCELNGLIQELEEKCQGSAQKMLQDVKGTLSRSVAVQPAALEAVPLEIHTACDVPRLYFDVKTLLRSHQVSVTFDPETAHQELILSPDQRQVARGSPQEHLDRSPRRFTASPCVLGCESFTSGKYYFEVDVGEGTGWDIGVCVESVPRDICVIQQPCPGFWAIRLCPEEGCMALTVPPSPLPLKEQPQVVGVFLDCEVGLVSFYNMTTGSHIFSFPKASFSEMLRPYFQVYPYSPLFLARPWRGEECCQTWRARIRACSLQRCVPVPRTGPEFDRSSIGIENVDIKSTKYHRPSELGFLWGLRGQRSHCSQHICHSPSSRGDWGAAGVLPPEQGAF